MNGSDFGSAVMRSIMSNEDHHPQLQRPKLAPEIEAIRLRDALDAFLTPYQFSPGMIVRQKKQAPQYTVYGHNDFAIVVEVLPTPIIDESKPSGGAYFRHRMDMIVGSIEQMSDVEGFALFHVDSRVFEPVPLDELVLLTKSAGDDARRAGPPTSRKVSTAPDYGTDDF